MIKQTKIIVSILTFFLVRGKLKVKVFPSSTRSGEKMIRRNSVHFFPTGHFVFYRGERQIIKIIAKVKIVR